MKFLVQKFGGTSVASDEARQLAAGKVIRAIQAGWHVVVVVSAIGRAGAPYATDTLVSTLKSVDPSVAPAPRELDMMMACGEIISTVVLAQTLHARGLDTVALMGGQAGILTDYEFGNARILSIDPTYIVKMLQAGKVVLVAGFQGVTEYGAVTTLGRGGSDTTASALGAALKAHADEVVVEIYTDVEGVKTADPRMVPGARTLPQATYAEVAEMAHQGAKVVHPRAAEIADQYRIPLWVKSTFDDSPGTLITAEEDAAASPRITGVTHTGKIVYLRFTLPESASDDERGRIELEIYRILEREAISIHLTSTGGHTFSFAIAREHLARLRELIDGLVLPIDLGVRRQPPFGKVYLLGLGTQSRAYQAQRTLLEKASAFVEVHTVEAEVLENCTMVSVIASGLTGLSGMVARILETLDHSGIPVYQTADSRYSISALIPEADVQRATRALHDEFALHQEAADGK